MFFYMNSAVRLLRCKFNVFLCTCTCIFAQFKYDKSRSAILKSPHVMKTKPRQFRWTGSRSQGCSPGGRPFRPLRCWELLRTGLKGGEAQVATLLLSCDTRSICMLLPGIWSFSLSLCIFRPILTMPAPFPHTASSIDERRSTSHDANPVFYCL